MAKEYDVIIAGTGVAGLYTALNLDSSVKALLISKRELTLCNSALAQGGIASVIDEKNDSFQLHINDTFIAGGFKNNMEHTNILVHEGPDCVRDIMKHGVEFDKNEDGSLNLTLEGGHSRRRIAHHKDATGFEMVTKLLAEVQKLPNVDIMESAMLCDCRKINGGFLADILKGEEHS